MAAGFRSGKVLEVGRVEVDRGGAACDFEEEVLEPASEGKDGEDKRSGGWREITNGCPNAWLGCIWWRLPA